MRPSILCISFSDIQADARVLRQLQILSEFGDVTTLGYGDKPVAAVDHLQLDASLPSLPQTASGVALLAVHAFRRVELAAPAMRASLRLTAGRSFDLVVANEARALPLAHSIAGKAPVWGDMHEWAPEERIHVLSWRLLVKPFMTAVCAEYLPRSAAISVVNDSIARLYERQFGSSTVTVRNARPFVDLQPSAGLPGIVRLVHSGAAIPGRNLEGMISAARKLGPGYTLDLYLVPARDGGKYLRVLEGLAGEADNVTIHPPVAPDELPDTLNQYDVGVFSLPPRTRNHALMLPNKFFDFVQARLAVVFSPSPETSRLISDHRLGTIARDFSEEALVDAVRGMSREDIERFKANAHAAARILSSDADEAVQRGLLRRLLD
ncbi:glycosyltransferase family 4 protein [Arthrobacter echini]|uniref:Glycosyltransferase family 4 protein n=1 Tax=Arthrobacter echini TaxID=1529066 RepID=A0A4S5E3K0_9MICC|nr:glycosyltransferase family 4 protein [Arthrobacter echini]THJ65960.1 glycosyltransferase family 4 protein [Arthrobacter echini]